MIWCTLNPRQARLLSQRNRFTSDPVSTVAARFSQMCLGSVCDRVFELSPFDLRGDVLVEPQTLIAQLKEAQQGEENSGYPVKLNIFMIRLNINPFYGGSAPFDRSL